MNKNINYKNIIEKHTTILILKKAFKFIINNTPFPSIFSI